MTAFPAPGPGVRGTGALSRAEDPLAMFPKERFAGFAQCDVRIGKW